MKKTSLKIYVTMLLLTISTTGCASSLKQLPSLENRTLRIDPNNAGFLYQYEKCDGKIWPFKKCKLDVLRYDFTKKATREKLKNMGFKLKVLKF